MNTSPTPELNQDDLIRARIRQRPHNAGRGLVRLLKHDYLGTLRDLLRLRADDQLRLAGAYIDYYIGIGGTARLTTEQVVEAWWRSYNELTTTARLS